MRERPLLTFVKVRYFFLFGLILCPFFLISSVSAQPVVVVTQLQQVIRLSPAWRSVLSEESFPGNLQKDSAWNQQVVQRTRRLLGQKWNGAQLQFTEGEAVQFALTSQPVLSPPVINGDRSQGNVFIGIVQGISLTTTALDSAGMPVRNFTNTCLIRAEDPSGKVLWESRVIVPFSTVVRPGTMYGQAEIGPDDLARLFVLSLQTALESPSKRLPSQVFYRPPFETGAELSAGAQGKTFLSTARPVSLQEEIPEFVPRRGEARQARFTLRQGKEEQVFETSQQFIGNAETPSGIILTRGQLTNKTSGQAYQVIAELSLPTDQEVSAESRRKTPIAIRCTAEGLVAGRFTLTHQHFEGQWGYEVYNFRRIPPKNTLEIRLNDKLVALIQRGGINRTEGRKVRSFPVLLSSDLSPSEKADLLTVILVYQMAYALGQDYLEY